MSIRDYGLLASVIIIWGVNFWFMKLGLEEMPPLVLGIFRFAFVLLPAIFFLKRPPVAWKWLILYGLTISFGQFSLMFLALSWNFPTGLAALILQAQAFLTVLFSAILWKEPVRAHQIVGMGTAGCGLVLIGVGQYQGNLPIAGVFPVLGAALSWACGNMIVKKIGRVDALSLVVWGSVSTLVAFALSAIFVHGVDNIAHYISNFTWRGIVGFLFLAYVASLVGYSAFGSLLARYPANKVSPFILLVPVLALVVGYLFLDEKLGVWHIGGIVAVMGGLLVHVFGGHFWLKSRGVKV